MAAAGDGSVDIITLRSVNEEYKRVYYRTLKLKNGRWKQILQTVDTKN